ncbi:xanthine dehydrogenase small subunit [Nocardioides donggukensis]|uniref:FAD binding domain-containing protein n=1 Tax=Nocardioides donggukensis TaxID=2774019 RepID=A0A927K6A4_9ACTN|nr:FAD binding domain-containing protein [Nocardioides donggukensis]MBD8871009.1 FAD binding domain-containing protein [Nocardioides donggukensis]
MTTAQEIAEGQPGSATVNGRARGLAGITSHTTALDWLRGLGLTGAKEGCAEGECGACSVLVARPAIAATGESGAAQATGGTEWVALNACLLPAAGLDGQEVVTAEGLAGGGSAPERLHPVQRELADRGGSQCGYCTPGFVCSMAAEYYRPGRADGSAEAGDPEAGDPEAGDHEAERGATEQGPNGFDLHALGGNLCRCTGYRPIRDAAYALGTPAAGDPLAERRDRPPPAVPATRVSPAPSGSARSSGSTGGGYLRPGSLAEALEILAEHPEATVLAGSTDLGVEVNLRGARPAYLLAVDRLPELRGLAAAGEQIRLGAALSLTEVERLLARRVPLLDDLFWQFGSRLVRNAATLGGNLGTGSPIGDAPPALLALDASLVLASWRDGGVVERVVDLADYFTGYRTTRREPGELITEVVIPLPLAGLTAFHKIAKRRYDDISSVAVGFALDVHGGEVRRARIGLGGVAATPVRARATEEALTGRPWDDRTVAAAAERLAEEGTPLDDHRASARYRAAMLGESLRKLYAEHPDPALPDGALA